MTFRHIAIGALVGTGRKFATARLARKSRLAPISWSTR